MASHAEEVAVNVIPPDKAKIAKLWKTAGILLVITLIEFAIAFAFDASAGKTFVFIALTVVKAAFIVGEFMHLRYEAKVLLWAILIPLIFVVWMLVAFIYEGTAIGAVRF